ncbi:MAG TPA: F0F1 ATP synthase subunit A [Candidatus Saccharimonadales bacterium]|jgi:F-type H+-transporting ATPase subunit a|nr:F0F1 ATP synthase subunit A [Candidatus Saccharimonadales bacterium]
MLSLLNRFADAGPEIHLTPNVVFHLGPLVITNAILYGWICSAVIIVTLIVVARRMTIKPKGGLTQFVELITEFIRNMVEGAFEDKKKADKYIPYFLSVFILFLLVNWLGLLPFTGDAFRSTGQPLFRPFTGDLNATFAAAAITMAYVYISSIREAGGFLKYLRHFFVGSPKNPMYFAIGILEMISDASRVISLSLRLFLNVAIGEMIIAVFSYLGHFLAPLTALPFFLIDAFDVALQAYIFVILSVMYLAIAVNHGPEEANDLTKEDVPDRIKLQPERG